MSNGLLNGFNNGKDASDGVGGKPSSLDMQLMIKSKKIEERHAAIKAEMLKLVDAMSLLEKQYDELKEQLYVVEREYVDNLKNMM